jgi:hypothetical protein
MLRATDGFKKQLEAAVKELDAVVVTAVAEANYQSLDRDALKVLVEELHQPKGRAAAVRRREIKTERYRAIAQAIRLRLAEQTAAEDQVEAMNAMPPAAQNAARAE